MNNINFDDFSDSYDSLMEKHLAGYGDLDYFGKSKAKLIRKMLKGCKESVNILDFGCGTGRNLPHLKSFFPDAKLYAFDISKSSLDHAKQNNPDVSIIYENAIDSYPSVFDIIFISGVFHHVEPEFRKNIVKRAGRLLNDHGAIAVFEHNPLNPVTSSIVRDCPFDKDAVLITKRELCYLFTALGFRKLAHRYTLFLPPKLKTFDFIEEFLHWLPIGAQYCIIFTK